MTLLSICSGLLSCHMSWVMSSFVTFAGVKLETIQMYPKKCQGRPGKTCSIQALTLMDVFISFAESSFDFSGVSLGDL